MRQLALAGMVALALCACGREPASGTEQRSPAGTGGSVAAGPADPAPVPVALDDVMERDPRYLIGISYPPVARAHPGLARLLQAYAAAARAELMQAVEGLGDTKPTMPYDLSLAFTELVATPQVVAVAADGSSYTGGAHGNPLVARFTWLPESKERLTAAKLVPTGAGWQVVSAYVREQLATDLSQRVEAAGYPPDERAQLLEGGLQMIDQGTTPEPANFDQFEPVLDGDGRITALRFVFPPYQVGPYSDGTQYAEVPARVLLPVVAPGYRHLFQGG